MDRIEPVTTTITQMPNTSRVQADEATQLGTPERTARGEFEDRIDTQEVLSEDFETTPRVKPAEKIIKSLESDTVETTFERLAHGDFRREREANQKNESGSSVRESGRVEEPLKDSSIPAHVLEDPEFQRIREELVGDSKDPNLDLDTKAYELYLENLPDFEIREQIMTQIQEQHVDPVLHGALLNAISEGRTSDAQSILAEMLKKEGLDPEMDSVIKKDSQNERTKVLEKSNKELRGELKFTQEQLAQAMKIMQDLAEVLKKMVDEEKEDSKKKQTLLELLLTITGFMLSFALSEITKRDGPAEGPPHEEVGFKSKLFSSPESPQEAHGV